MLWGNHNITFCNDNTDQMLYITSHKSPKIDIIFMKDHHSEEVETSKDFAKSKDKKLGNEADGILNKIEYSIEAN